MDRFEVKKLVEDCFKMGGKYQLSKALSPDDMSHLIDVLWDYMEDSEDAFVYKRELEELREKIKNLNDKSGQRVRCVKALPNRRALVQLGPIKEEVLVSPDVDMSKLKTGVEVLVIGSSDGRLLAGVRNHDIYDGRVSRVQRVLDDERVVIDDGGHELIMKVADWVFCKEGDEVRYELESQMILEVLGAKENGTFSLAEVPEVSFEDVKGLEDEKKYLQERLIYPTVYKEKFTKYGLKLLKAALFHGPPGCGKAQPLDAKVVTPQGLVDMKDISVGSKVCTPSGSFAKVLETFPQGKLDIYRVFFSDGTHTECCKDHLWCVQTSEDRLAKNNNGWRILPLSEIMGKLRSGGKRRFSIPMTQPVEFEQYELPLDPYLFGVLLGDGGFSAGCPTITSGDEEIITYFKEALLSMGLNVKKSYREYDYRISKISKSSGVNPLTSILRKLELYGCRSWEKFIPKVYKFSAADDRLSLLQGLLDSDGFVSKDGYKITFSSTSRLLANDVRFLAESLGCKVTLKHRQTKYTYQGNKNLGRISYRLAISFPNTILPFRLSRKLQRYVPRTKYQPTRYIDKVEYIGIKEAKCILIDHPDHMYMTNNFIVTHNTFLAKAIFNEMLKLREKYANVKGTSDQRGFFLINGPEVLSKWAGNTEAAIRKIFDEARNMAETTGFPSVIFWDEIESITGKRKDTATYTPEKTVVPTLLAELQGVDSNHDVVLIGATNRPDLIDPALMRPGRLGDAILEIPRPDKEAALEILGLEFSRGEIPELLQKLIDDGLKEKLVEHVYDNETPLAMATLKSGKKLPLMCQEQASGALFSQLGEELVRNTCISEIQNTESITIEGAIELAENIMLNQIGVLDAGVKSGFTFNTEDYVLDVSLSA